VSPLSVYRFAENVTVPPRNSTEQQDVCDLMALNASLDVDHALLA
jgi:diphthamide biosynthesis methyltransferase